MYGLDENMCENQSPSKHKNLVLFSCESETSLCSVLWAINYIVGWSVNR